MLVLYIAVGAFLVGGGVIMASDLFIQRNRRQAFRRGF